MSKTIKLLFTVIIITSLVLITYGGVMYAKSSLQEKEAIKEAEIKISSGIEHINNDKEVTVKQVKENFIKNELNKGDAFGKLILPKINAELPIIEGVAEDELAKGVGHDALTGLPLDNEQIVLSGHRDTVFRGVKELEIGDIMEVQTAYGSFEYEIFDIYIVSADDLTVIVPHDEEKLTVTTCYPFNYIGSSPDRYIIDAKPLFDVEKVSNLEFKPKL